MKHLTVTAAILTHNNEYLCMQRGPSKYDYIAYKYEFPGGKVEDSESLEAGLSRELFEEMDIHVDIKPEHFFYTVTHEYPDFKITMHSYLCPIDNRIFTLKEHIGFKWLTIDELSQPDWAQADIPIVEELMRRFK